MSTIVFDPKSAREFRDHLRQFNGDLDEEFKRMLFHWESLGPIWQDEAYRRFGDALQEVAKGIKRYLDMTEEHDRFLSDIIKAGEDYEKVRIRY